MSKGNVLITGVSTGIGYHCAKKFISEGFTVYGSVRKQEDADRLMSDFGNQFSPLIFDVTDQSAINEARSHVESEVGSQGLSLLINNSGIVVPGPVELVSLDDYRKQFEVNVFGLIAVTKAFMPLLGASKKSKIAPGKIINISSVASKRAMPFMTPYSASKAAVDAFSDGLRRELMIYGIDVAVLNPGAIKTPIWDKAEKLTSEALNSDYATALVEFVKMILAEAKNAIDPDDFADLVFTTFRQKSPKTFNVVMKNKFFKYTLPTLFAGDRMFDRLIKKALKM